MVKLEIKMNSARFLNGFGLLIVLCCIQSSIGQVALQSDYRSRFEFKNELKDLEIFKNVSNIPSSIDFNDPSLPWRLPQDIRPYHYDLFLLPILEAGHETLGEQWTTPGTVKISVTAMADTSKITLHTRNLTIQNLIVQRGATVLPINGTSYNEEYMHFTIQMESSLTAGQNYTISVNFTAQIQIELHGLYRSSYVDLNSGETKWMAVTQMEALNARELFPCFDESSFKAVFQVVIGRLEKHIALANAQSISNTTNGINPGWVLEAFAPTVPMSSYLFAIVISEFEYAEAPGIILPQTIVRTYAPKHFIQREGGVYASEKAEKVLKFYGEYFGEEYPMAKMDMAAVPAFFFGAMENFGLNVYREDALLYFPDETTEAERLQITQVISHELAHQWFGNLVSPAFWTHIWLNEGVSSYVEFLGIQELIPEYNPWDIFVTDSIQRAMQVDAVDNHPLKIGEVEWYGKEAMDWFDGITYQKGGSIMRMVHGFLTEPVLRKGLNRYQTRMKYSAAVQDDLFQDLGIEANLADKLPNAVTMKEIMDTWTLQTGYPVLTVSRSGTTNVVRQEKFGNSTSTSQWIIPVSYATQGNPNFDAEPEFWLTEATSTISEPISTWVILNAGVTGFYRVKYDANIEPLILEQLEANHTIINHHSRSQLLDDYFNFVPRGMVTVGNALNFTKFLGTSPEPEVEMVVWEAILNNLLKPYYLLSSTPILEDMKKYLIPRINRAVEATGGFSAINANSKGMVVLRHKLLLDWACGMADVQCLDYALGLVNIWKANTANNPVQRDLKPIVYCGAVATGGADAFDFIYERYGEDGITSKQMNYLLNALSCANVPDVLERLLNGTVTDGFFLQKAHGETILRGVAGNSRGRQSLIKFLTDNVQKLIAFYGTPNPIIRAFAELSRFMGTAGELAQLEAFITANQGTFQQSLAPYVNSVRQNIAWVNTFGPEMQDFFVHNA